MVTLIELIQKFQNENSKRLNNVINLTFKYEADGFISFEEKLTDFENAIANKVTGEVFNYDELTGLCSIKSTILKLNCDSVVSEAIVIRLVANQMEQIAKFKQVDVRLINQFCNNVERFLRSEERFGKTRYLLDKTNFNN